MKLSLGIVIALATTGSIVACSSGDEAAAPGLETPETEGGALPPPQPDAAAVTDAGGGDADAEAAAPRVCSDDGFCHTSVPTDQTLRGVWSDGAGIAWAVSEEGAILRFDGASWTQHTKTKGALRAVWGSSPTDLWVGGNDGLFHGTGATSSALTFENVSAPGNASAPITSIWGTGSKDVWAVGNLLTFPYVARVLRYSDGFAGAGWQIDPISTSPILTARVWGNGTSGVWIAGQRNNPITINQEVVTLRRAIGSGSFVEVPMPKDPDGNGSAGQIDKLFDGAVGADGTVWVLGRTNTSKPGFARGTTTDGTTFTWTFVPHGPSVGPVSNFVWGNGKSDMWVGGEYGRFHHWDGAAWLQARTTVTKFPDTTDLNAIWGAPNGEMWVVGKGIALHKAAPKKS